MHEEGSLHMKITATASRAIAFSAFLSVASMLLLPLAAHAASSDAPGCNEKVMKAMEAKAQAKVAYDVAATEQIIKKPDSVLAMTCAYDKAIEAAKRADFSGDFSTDVQNALRDDIANHYKNFAGSTGQKTGTVNYALTGTNTNCESIGKLWDKISTTGIEQGAPAVTMTEMMNNKLPAGAGTEFKANMTASKDVAGELKSAIAAIPKPKDGYVAYTPGETSCEYMAKMGVGGGC